ncbi:hypothetical protein DVS28_b0112 (plasmid) [Euzebya pacifica]|uniref:Prepilin-type N-terminal cleavage/methylation domain-containing protein n=1 Tax=Euzebya pacifica TaxID=1608957 RepID=A0A346Y5Y5_9ACTN|nr:hypothetical protein [Euzebya pacifica]AXV09882.1 hypothetical protein DVS28_b0112 [Euzebya pacifica]
MRGIHTDESGITLAEMMVSIVIITITLTALAGVIIQSLRTVSTNEQTVEGTHLVARLLEDVRTLPWPCIGFDTTDPDYAATSPSGTTVAISSECPAGFRADRPRMNDGDVTVGGVDYDVEQEIVWVDDPAVPGTQNHKEIVVRLAWDGPAGTPHTTEARTTRVPTPAEVPVEEPPADCTPGELLDFSITPTVIELSPSGFLRDDVHLFARTCGEVMTVRVDAPTRGTVSLTDDDGDGTLWRATIGAGTAALDPGTFDWTGRTNGMGADPDDSATVQVTVFSPSDPVQLRVDAITLSDRICASSNGSSSNTVRNPVDITVDVVGIAQASAGSVTIGWTSVNATVAATHTGSGTESSTWTARLPAGTTLTNDTTTIEVRVVRTEDNETAVDTAIVPIDRVRHQDACP